MISCQHKVTEFANLWLCPYIILGAYSDIAHTMITCNHSMSKTLNLWLHAQISERGNNLVGPPGLEPGTKGFT